MIKCFNEKMSENDDCCSASVDLKGNILMQTLQFFAIVRALKHSKPSFFNSFFKDDKTIKLIKTTEELDVEQVIKHINTYAIAHALFESSVNREAIEKMNENDLAVVEKNYRNLMTMYEEEK